MEDPQRATISFSSARKRMSTLVALPDGQLRLFCKGASEMVLGLCTQVVRPDGKAQEMTQAMREALEKSIESFADDGLRTIAVAYRDLEAAPDMEDADGVEQQLTLVALLGLEDPVRPEVPAAVEMCKQAGIVVRMVTGDNPRTAVAIAKKCGILGDSDAEGLVMTGVEMRARAERGEVGGMHRAEAVAQGQDCVDVLYACGHAHTSMLRILGEISRGCVDGEDAASPSHDDARLLNRHNCVVYHNRHRFVAYHTAVAGITQNEWAQTCGRRSRT